MNRRIIQDVVFPSQRNREEISEREAQVSPPPLSSLQPERPVEHSPETRNATEDFLPKLIKKDTAPSEREGQMGGGYDSGNRSPRVTMWIITTIVLVVALGVLFSKFFSGATVKIVPLNEEVVLNTQFIAHEISTEEGDVPFQRIMLPNEERSAEVSETVEKEVSKKASGKIRIFNEYNTQSQRLIKNTRFESEAGKIYRIDGSVDVPGATVTGGKVTPGSVVVTVYADIPGESYNSAPADFTIPGFKGDPRYEKFYARSETPLEGGFVGKVKVPTPEVATKAKDSLKASLGQELMQKAQAQVPQGFILYPSAAFVVFDELANGATDPTSDHVSVKGVFYGIIFDKGALSRAIAKKALTVYDDSPVTVRNIEELSLTPSQEVTDPAGIKEFSFTLSGSAHIVWDVSIEKLKSDLLSVDKKDGFQKVIASHGAIKKAESKVLPFWKKNFPDDVKDIKIEEILE